MGKGEIACNKQFLLFPQCFLLNQIIVSLYLHIFDIISLFAAELEECKISISGKGLTLPNDKILDYSKFKALADDKIIVTQKLKFGLGRVENIVGKGENAVYHHFLLFQQCFRKLSFPEVLKVGIVWKKG